MKKLIQLLLLFFMASLFLLCAKKEAPYVVKVARQTIPSVVFEKKFRSSPEFRDNVSPGPRAPFMQKSSPQRLRSPMRRSGLTMSPPVSNIKSPIS